MTRTTKIKIITTVICIFMIVMCVTTTVFGAFSPKDLKATDTEPGDMSTWAANIMGIIRNVAIIASVIVLMVIGVKFILGSTEEKAEYKKSLVPIVIGIVLVVGATTLAAFIFDNAVVTK